MTVRELLCFSRESSGLRSLVLTSPCYPVAGQVKTSRLAAQVREQQAETRKLEAAIEATLAALGFGRQRRP